MVNTLYAPAAKDAAIRRQRVSVKRAFFMFRSPLFAFSATRGRIRCRSCPAFDGRYPSVRFGRVTRPPLAGGPPELSGADAGYRVASCIGIRSSGGSAGRLQSRGSGGTFWRRSCYIVVKGHFASARHPQSSRLRRAAAPSAGAVLMPCCRAGRVPA